MNLQSLNTVPESPGDTLQLKEERRENTEKDGQKTPQKTIPRYMKSTLSSTARKNDKFLDNAPRLVKSQRNVQERGDSPLKSKAEINQRLLLDGSEPKKTPAVRIMKKTQSATDPSVSKQLLAHAKISPKSKIVPGQIKADEMRSFMQDFKKKVHRQHREPKNGPFLTVSIERTKSTPRSRNNLSISPKKFDKVKHSTLSQSKQVRVAGISQNVPDSENQSKQNQKYVQKSSSIKKKRRQSMKLSVNDDSTTSEEENLKNYKVHKNPKANLTIRGKNISTAAEQPKVDISKNTACSRKNASAKTEKTSVKKQIDSAKITACKSLKIISTPSDTIGSKAKKQNPHKSSKKPIKPKKQMDKAKITKKTSISPSKKIDEKIRYSTEGSDLSSYEKSLPESTPSAQKLTTLPVFNWTDIKQEEKLHPKLSRYSWQNATGDSQIDHKSSSSTVGNVSLPSLGDGNISGEFVPSTKSENGKLVIDNSQSPSSSEKTKSRGKINNDESTLEKKLQLNDPNCVIQDLSLSSDTLPCHPEGDTNVFTDELMKKLREINISDDDEFDIFNSAPKKKADRQSKKLKFVGINGGSTTGEDLEHKTENNIEPGDTKKTSSKKKLNRKSSLSKKSQSDKISNPCKPKTELSVSSSNVQRPPENVIDNMPKSAKAKASSLTIKSNLHQRGMTSNKEQNFNIPVKKASRSKIAQKKSNTKMKTMAITLPKRSKSLLKFMRSINIVKTPSRSVPTCSVETPSNSIKTPSGSAKTPSISVKTLSSSTSKHTMSEGRSSGKSKGRKNTKKIKKGTVKKTKKDKLCMPFGMKPKITEKVDIFKRQFRLYAKFGDRRNSGETISMVNTVRWMKQASVIGNHKVTTNDIEIYFIYTTQRRRSLRMLEFVEFLKTLCSEKSLNLSGVVNRLIECGIPAVSVTDVTIENMLASEFPEQSTFNEFSQPLSHLRTSKLADLPYKSSAYAQQLRKEMKLQERQFLNADIENQGDFAIPFPIPPAYFHETYPLSHMPFERNLYPRYQASVSNNPGSAQMYRLSPILSPSSPRTIGDIQGRPCRSGGGGIPSGATEGVRRHSPGGRFMIDGNHMGQTAYDVVSFPKTTLAGSIVHLAQNRGVDVDFVERYQNMDIRDSMHGSQREMNYFLDRCAAPEKLGKTSDCKKTRRVKRSPHVDTLIQTVDVSSGVDTE